MTARKWMPILGLVAAAAATRLVPHPPNFTAVGALGLFGGAWIADRRLAFGAPILAMGLSDLGLAAFVYGTQAFSGITPFVYLAMAACVGLGLLLRGRCRPLAVGVGAGASAVAFFVVTNLGVWIASGMYPWTGGGLAACFAAALPFFGRTLAAHLLFAGVLFGAAHYADRPSAAPARA